MKNLFLFIFFLSYSISISQTSNSSLAASVELYPIAKSTSNPSASTYFSMELVSQVWGREVTGSSYTTLNTWQIGRASCRERV